MLAGCPVLCGQMCHHCETCLRFSHGLRSAPQGRWHSGRHQLGLNSGGKTCLPHPPPPGVGTGQEAVSTSVSRLIAELSANQHSPLIGQSAPPLDRPISTPPWDVCALLPSCWWVGTEDRSSYGLALWFRFCCFIKTNENQKEKTIRSFWLCQHHFRTGFNSIPRERGSLQNRPWWSIDMVHRLSPQMPLWRPAGPFPDGGWRGVGGDTPLKAADPQNKCWQKNVYKGL